MNELRARREKLQQCLRDFDKLLETEDLSPINRSYAEDLKKIGTKSTSVPKKAPGIK